MNGVIVRLPIPHTKLWPNRPTHYRTRAKLRKEQRWEAEQMTKRASKNLRPRWSRARLTIKFFWPDYRRRDPYNAAAALKGAIDGVVDAGLIVDDNWTVLEAGPMECSVDNDDPRVEFHFEALEENDTCPFVRNVRSRGTSPAIPKSPSESPQAKDGPKVRNSRSRLKAADGRSSTRRSTGYGRKGRGMSTVRRRKRRRPLRVT
jgi:hypothetical protein